MKTQVMVATAILLCLTGSAHAEQINMRAIARIESSNNPLAYNERTQATGLYQITLPALTDYNNYHKKKHALSEMFEPKKCYSVANWYMNFMLPKYFKYYKIEDTVENRLIAWHDGIGNLIKFLNNKRTLGKEMRGFMGKYNEMSYYIRKYNEINE